MRILIVENYPQLSSTAAGIVASQVILKNNCVLGLPTGSTPEGMYGELVQLQREEKVDFSEVVTFNLDEYLGLSPEHPQSYHHYMHHHFFNHIPVPPQNIHIPPGRGDITAEHCREYDSNIAAAGGIDLQVLGIGVNGHIGFNEPGQYLKTGTHVVELTEETVEANSRFFDSREHVPRQAITMGMGSILGARKILLLAGGKNKAPAIRESLNGNITTNLPASFLQLHSDVILVLDREAASQLPTQHTG